MEGQADASSTTNRREFVWFFGPSCAGKEHTIRSIAADDASVAAGLNLRGRITACESSIAYKTGQRPSVLAHLSSSHQGLDGALLIKGQTNDLLQYDALSMIANGNSALHQRIVFVHSPPELLSERRLRTRCHIPYWRNWTLQSHIDELRIQSELMESLEGRYEVLRYENLGLPLGNR
jgi:hypothetical protein